MLLGREYRILEKRSGALAVGIARKQQHPLERADVPHSLARLGKIGRCLAAFEVMFQISVADARFASGGKRVDDPQDHEPPAFAGIKNARAISEAASLAAQFTHGAVFEIE